MHSEVQHSAAACVDFDVALDKCKALCFSPQWCKYVPTAPSYSRFALNFGHPVFTAFEQGKFVMTLQRTRLVDASLRPPVSQLARVESSSGCT